ncbi:hypothetical protein KEG38_35710 [Polyangium jinanense]|uniref:hypothetical protein n=1 Tax=Polyangium jinanense TaxID=2829994 RepID=UPI00234169F6|nr:hypothetical protein [Polyangium jinanense]MDC3959256.1 hypothetical protein [Polyangium jinanense]
MSRKAVLLDRVDAQLVDDVERAVRAAKALPSTRLSQTKLTPEASAELVRQLVARGLERSPKTIRVPLAAQIESLLQGGARVPLKDVGKRVKGGTKAELDAALAKFIREGHARVVVRTQVEVLVGPAERALDPTEIAHLSKTAAQVSKTLKKVQAKGLPRSILQEDLAALFAPLQPSLRLAATTPDQAPSMLVDEALRRLEDPALKLVRIPDLVRALSSRLSLDAIHRALAEGAKDGTLELRPEAGAEFLKPEDVPLCPPGPRGTVLSYARRVSP